MTTHLSHLHNVVKKNKTKMKKRLADKVSHRLNNFFNRHYFISPTLLTIVRQQIKDEYKTHS
jgi:hypothetical protein